MTASKACSRAAAEAGVALRPMADADYAFCEALYASTRQEELAPLGWPETAVRAFLAQQHRAQHSHYREQYTAAEWWIIEREGVPIGRLYLSEGAEALELIDIALLPGHRGRGIGGILIAAVQAHAGAAGKRVYLYVEKNNPARSLYFRLGFAMAEDCGVYDLLAWRDADPS